MNILFISTQLYPCKIGGVEIFNYYLINALARNHDIWVITSCNTSFNQKNINVIKINPKKFISQKLSVIYEHSKNILEIKDKIGIVHIPYMSRSWPYGCYLPILKKICDLPYILSLHGGAMLPWKPKFVHKLLFQNADAIIAVSETMKREYEKRSGREIKVIPPLIPFKKSGVSKSKLREKFGFKKDDKIILSLGSINKIKGSDILLNAFMLLGEDYIKNRQIRLLYVGDGVMKNNLKEEVNYNSFESYVKFLGNVSHEKVPEMFKLADIFVIPSMFEATPISLLEAMFNGLPIIGTNTEGITNLISANVNGLLFEKNNYKSLMNKIKKLISENDLMMKVGRKAEEYFKKSFNFENVVSDHIKLYEQVARKR